MDDKLNEQAKVLWQSAREKAVKGDGRGALDALRSGDPRLQKLLHWRLFEIHQLGLLNEHRLTLTRAESFISDLLLLPDIDLNEQYFLAFAQWYGQVAYRSLHPDSNWPSTLDFDLSPIDLKQVALRWKLAFPMKIHADWDSDYARRTVGAAQRNTDLT